MRKDNAAINKRGRSNGPAHEKELPRQDTASQYKSRKMRAGHVIVLQALKIANVALRRVVSLEEVLKALSPNEIKMLESTYSKDLSQATSSIISMLMARGVVFSPGCIGRRRYYGSMEALNSKTSTLPDFQSRRQRVLMMIRAAVKDFGRAVRIGDLVEHARANGGNDIAPELITRSVLSLLETRDIKCIDTVRGDVKGGHLYLPSDLDPELYRPKEPLTWMGIIEKTTLDLLEERKTMAAIEGRRMRPISTGEVRNRLAAQPDPHPNLKEPMLLISALRQLIQTNDARIRKIDLKGRKMVFWAPIEVSDECLDLGDAYAKDTERVAEAFRRAVQRRGRPVNAQEVQQEVDEDPFLRPTGTSSLACILSDIARETVGWENEVRRPRITRHVFKVGRIDSDAYYFHNSKKLPQAQAYVRLRQIESAWEMTRAEWNLNSLKTCSLKTVALGRAMLILSETHSIMEEIGRLFEDHKMDVFTRKEATKLRTLISRVFEDTKIWLSVQDRSNCKLPQEVLTDVPSWTAKEILPYLKPVYSRARRVKVPNELVLLLSKDKDIRRVPNPHFNNRFDDDPHSAAEYLYDRTDALIYVAGLGRGYEGRLQAHFARNELGWLRDARFVLPALSSKDFNERLAAISCLAFLWSDEGTERLRDLAISDPDPGVRQSALWAYRFAKGESALGVLRSSATNDTDSCVREFASRVLEAGDEFWWLI